MGDLADCEKGATAQRFLILSAALSVYVIGHLLTLKRCQTDVKIS